MFGIKKKPIDDFAAIDLTKLPPQRDLLNYKNMDLEMMRSANTGTGWLSVLVMVGLALACFVGMAITGWLLHW